MRRVLITDHPFGTGLEVEQQVLADLDVELLLAPSFDEKTLIELAATSTAMLVCYAPLQRPVLQAAAKGGCRVVARYGIGYDNVDVQAAAELGITVTNVPDYCLDEVADHTLALLLAAARGVCGSSAEVRAGQWRAGGPIHSLAGRVLGLVGLGRIGTRVAHRARAFGLRVVAYDPFVQDSTEVEMLPALDAVLSAADFVSLHVPLSSDSHHMIDEAAIEQMSCRPVLINTSRGGLIDLDAALRALNDGRLSGLALDVTDPEPLPANHPLRTHPGAIITPHIAFYSTEAQAELQRRAADEVARSLRGESPRSPVISGCNA